MPRDGRKCRQSATPTTTTTASTAATTATAATSTPATTTATATAATTTAEYKHNSQMRPYSPKWSSTHPDSDVIMSD